MNIPTVIPPSDLLQQVEGIESGLRQHRRLGILGWTGLVLSVSAQATVLILNSQYAQALWSALSHLNIPALITSIAPQWPLVTFVPLAVVFAVLVTWNRFWLTESREPFRFTYFVEDFTPVSPESTTPEMAEVRFSLIRALSERIARLSLLKEPPAERPAAGRRESHVHVSATYLVRRQRDDSVEKLLEIAPWVRIGPAGEAEALAHPVRIPLSGSPAETPLTPALVEQVLERLYFSVATQIYAQIRKDVQGKIDLLPTARFRAIAYFYEAADHARSNTVDAYDEARKLYDAALQLFDPSWAALPQARVPRLGRQCLQLISRGIALVRVKLSWVWPSVGRREVMIANAEIGYAKMLLNRTSLAALSGQRLNTVFEARPVTRRAVERLSRLPSDVPGRTEALFAAHCSRAFAESTLGAIQQSKVYLNEARDLAIGREGRDLPRPEQDSRYLFVAAELESNILDSLDQYRRAVELDPSFELARFTLATQLEKLWRRRRTFEPEVAEIVMGGYRDLLRLNPSNVAASANIGYLLWLLKDLDGAKRAFDQGREYKEVKPETYVAELDYGLARVAAEDGRFSDAYQRYINAVTAILALGVSHAGHATTAGRYYFEFIGPAMLQRFIGYRRKVFRELLKSGEFRNPGEIVNRLHRAIWAFVLNDYGEAEHSYYLRTGDTKRLKAASKAFEQAIQVNPGFLLPYYNLAIAGQTPQKYLRLAMEQKPNWADAKLALVEALNDEADESRKDAEKAELEAAMKEREASGTEVTLVDTALDAPARLSSAVTKANVAAANEGAASARAEAARLKSEADTKAMMAAGQRTSLEGLLPPWLALGTQDSRVMSKLLRDRGLVLERVWEKEFDTLQVQVLQLWATLELQSSSTDANGKGGDGARDVLKKMRKHYWPEDVALLRVLRDADPDRKDEYARAIQMAVTGWLENDPAFINLTWFDYVFRYMVPDLKACSTAYSRVSRQANLLPHAYGWLRTELKDIGQRFADDKNWDGMAEAYGGAAEASARSGNAGERAVCQLGLGEALWRLEKYDQAKEIFVSISAEATAAVEGGALSSGWRAGLARRLIDAPIPPGPYGELKQCFEVPFASLQDAPVARSDARRAAWLLVRDRKPWWKSETTERSARLPNVTPISVDVDPWVFPGLGESAAAKRLVTEEFPRLRQRFHEQWGVIIPGIRLGVDHKLTAGSYVISLSELPEAADRVLLQYEFCTDLESCQRLGLSGIDRVGPNGKHGVWLQQAMLERAASEQVPLLDPYDYIIWHLENVLSKQLTTFLGVDEVQNLLDFWQQGSSERRRAVDGAVPDAASLWRLTHVLRDLLGEGIPVTDLDTILETFASVNPYRREIEDVIAAIRLALAPQISRLLAGKRVMRLSSSVEGTLEGHIREEGGKRFLALPGPRAERLRAKLSAEYQTEPGPTAFVVHNTQVRPYVRRLLAEAFPTVLVVAEAELVSAPEVVPLIPVGVAGQAPESP